MDCSNGEILLRDSTEPSRNVFRSVRVTRLRALLLTLGVAAASVCAVAPASVAGAAEPLYVNLDYRVEGRPEGCWEEPELRRRVVKAVGYDPFRSSAATHVEVRVGRSASRVDGRVQWTSAEGADMGERRFIARDGDCTKLLTEMSFAIGLQIELLQPAPAPSSPPADTARPAAAAASNSARPSAASASPAQQSSPSAARAATLEESTNASISAARWDKWRLSLGVAPSLAVGFAPSPTVEARAFFGVRRRDWSAELGLETTWPVVERQPDGSGFRTNLLGASTHLCGHRGVLAGCVVGRLSQLRVTGLDVDQPQAPKALVAHTGIRLAATWDRSEHWFFTPHLDGLVLVTPRTVTLNHVEVWEVPLLAGLVGFDFGGRFR